MAGTAGSGGGPVDGPLGVLRQPSLRIPAGRQHRDFVAPPEPLHTLVDAVLTVGTDLDLSHVLERVAQAACRLVDAECGVLVLTTPDRIVTDCIVHGLSKEQRRAIGPLPEFAAFLDRFAGFRRTVRLADVRAHPAAVGYPAHYPILTSLLGVPIALRDETYGFLYLTNKERGAPFDQDDETAIRALTTAAGIAIENARLYTRERRRQRWLEAASEITHQLVGETDRTNALATVTRRLRAVSGADFSGLLLLDAVSPDTVDIQAVEGIGLEFTTGTRSPLKGLPAKVLETGRGIVSADLTHEEGYDPPDSWRGALSDVGLGMVMPLLAPGEILGVLYVCWLRDSPHALPSEREAPLVEMFAGQAAIAMQRIQAQQNQARLLLLEDRDRIASNLHDAVIQRLFAIGSKLHGAVGLSTRPEVKERVNAAIDELDEATREVRSAIFQLHQPDADVETPVRERLLTEIDASRELFGFTPRLVLHGGVDALTSQGRDELVGAVRDALSVAAGHGSATRVEVVLRVTTERLTLQVTDDGNAGPAGGREADATRIGALSEQAERLGGTCHVAPDGNGLSTLEWQVPRRP